MKFLQTGWKLSLVLLLLLTACSAKGKKTPCPQIPVGVVLGAETATASQEQKEGYELALSEINKAGTSQGCKIRLAYKTEGQAGNLDATQVAVLELADEGVAAILGATTNDATMRAAGIANYFKVPMIVPSETSDEITQAGNQWIFRLSASNKSAAAQTFEMVAGTVGEQANIAVLFEQTPFGESAAVVAGQAAMHRSLYIVSYQGYAQTAEDYTTLVENIQTAQPDVIYIISTKPKQAQDILAALRQAEVSSSFVVGVGSGFTGRDFLYDNNGALNAGLDNLVLPADWAADLPWHGIDKFAYDLQAYRKTLKSQTTAPPVVRNVEAYAALHLVVSVIDSTVKDGKENWSEKLAKPENMPAFREALLQTLKGLRATQNESVFGSVEFDSEGQNKLEAVLVQVIGGKLATVFPTTYAVQNPVFIKGW